MEREKEQKEINRRDFVKGIAVGGVVLATSQVVGAEK
jgi:hypothetical protein